MQATFNAAGAAHGDSARELIRRANDLDSGPVINRLGFIVKPGNHWECPKCRSYPESATFKSDDDINPSKRWRCTADGCDAGGSVVDLVALVRGLSQANAARVILNVPTVQADDGPHLETIVSSHEEPLVVEADDGKDDAGDFYTSTKATNAVENEVPAFVSSETRAEKKLMVQYSPNGADGPRASSVTFDDAFKQHVTPYLSAVLGDRKPREFRFIKPGRGVKDCLIWTPERDGEICERLRQAHEGGCNAYVTINPIRADLVDEVRRRWTERNPASKDKTTNDSDIERRAFIPIDVDPVRPSGTLATSEQVQAAKEIAKRIIEEWYRPNFPDHMEPLFGHSGSGYQILIPCDIPADSDGDEIVKGLLKLLAHAYDTEAAHVDTSVSNRSRIMRVCGTMAFYSDGKRFGAFKPYEAKPGEVLTVEDLRPIVPKRTPKPTPQPAAKPVNGTANRQMAKRLDAYIKPALAEITAAADGTKYGTLFKKTAHIANYVAGAGLQAHEGEYKARIREALKANAGHVESWEQAEKGIADAWSKGIADPAALPDREPPAKPIRANNAEGSPIDDGSDIEPKPEYDGRRYYDPHVIAEHFLNANESPVVVVKGVPYLYDSGVYQPTVVSDMTAELTRFTADFFEKHHPAEIKLFGTKENPEPPIRPVTKSVITNARLAVDAICTDSRVSTFPAWLRRRPDDWPANRVIHCENGLLNADTLEFHEGHNPRWLSLCKSEARWEGPDATCPLFLKWLMQVMPGNDAEAVKNRETLQMWFGYLLVPDRSHHKMLELIGERRTGKGTTLRLIQSLIGQKNVCHTSLTEISGRFGLEPLLGKTVAMIGDARPGKANTDLSTGAERMLAITGGDCLGVDRKGIPSLPSVDLPVRFVMASNGHFNMPDPNGVLPTRLVTLRFDQSFAGREDPGIEKRLAEELPGILAWAVRGLQRLTELGGFHELESTREACEISQEIAQPLLAFLNDAFSDGHADDTDLDDVYAAFVGWHARHKPRANPMSKTQFRNEIGSCRTGVRVVRRGTGNGRSRFLVGVTPNDSFEDHKSDGLAIIERQFESRETIYPNRRF